jgi:hypothetical protein
LQDLLATAQAAAATPAPQLRSSWLTYRQQLRLLLLLPAPRLHTPPPSTSRRLRPSPARLLARLCSCRPYLLPSHLPSPDCSLRQSSSFGTPLMNRGTEPLSPSG